MGYTTVIKHKRYLKSGVTDVKKHQRKIGGLNQIKSSNLSTTRVNSSAIEHIIPAIYAVSPPVSFGVEVFLFCYRNEKEIYKVVDNMLSEKSLEEKIIYLIQSDLAKDIVRQRLPYISEKITDSIFSNQNFELLSQKMEWNIKNRNQQRIKEFFKI